MKLLTHWGRDKITTICISFPNTFFSNAKKSPQFVLKGEVNYKSKLVQAMAWHREDTKPLPESVVIQSDSVYMTLSDWLSWLLHHIGKIYPYGEKQYCLSTRGIPSPPSLNVGNSDPSGRVGARDGSTIFCKIPTIGVFEYGKSNLTTIKHIYNESENLNESCGVAFDSNNLP